MCYGKFRTRTQTLSPTFEFTVTDLHLADTYRFNCGYSSINISAFSLCNNALSAGWMARTTLVSCYITILHYCPCTGCFQPAVLTLTHFELTTLPLVVPSTSQVCSLSPLPAISSSILAASLLSMPNTLIHCPKTIFLLHVYGGFISVEVACAPCTIRRLHTSAIC